MRHTNREIEEAKMLGRRLAALKNVSSPPLSRVRRATTLFVAASWTLLRMRVRSAWMKMLDRTVCPHCHGQGTGFYFCEGDEASITSGRTCRLCIGKGYIGQQQRESVKWGRALFDYRMERRHSLAFMQCAIGTPEHIIAQCESGLIALDDWPYPLYNIAEVHLGKTTA